jgi:hypothetical protein
MLGLFRPLAEYGGPYIVTVGALYFVCFLRCILKVSSESICLQFVERDIPSLIWILRFYYSH